MIITSYCGKNFKSCLDFVKDSWSFCKNEIYTDTSDFGIRLFQEETTDFKESCKRRIFALQKTLKKNPNEDVLLLDSDVMVMQSPQEVFSNNFDLTLTRIIKRRNSNYEDANIGVMFVKSNQKTIDLCDIWLSKTEEYFPRDLTNPDQTAITDIFMQAYDGLIDLKVGNVSENIYNFERLDIKSWTNDILKYKPKLIHLKNKMWQNEYCRKWLLNYAKK